MLGERGAANGWERSFPTPPRKRTWTSPIRNIASFDEKYSCDRRRSRWSTTGRCRGYGREGGDPLLILRRGYSMMQGMQEEKTEANVPE